MVTTHGQRVKSFKPECTAPATRGQLSNSPQLLGFQPLNTTTIYRGIHQMKPVKTAKNPWSRGLVERSRPGMSCTTLEGIAPTAVELITLPWVKPPLSMNQTTTSKGAVYARNKTTREIRQTIQLLAQSRRLPHNCRYSRVQLGYVPADNRRRDTDNLVATLKPICDGLVDYGLVKDDTPEFMGKVEPVIWLRREYEQPRLVLVVECWQTLPKGFLTRSYAPWWVHADR